MVVLCCCCCPGQEPVPQNETETPKIEPAVSQPYTRKEWSQVQLYKFLGGGKVPEGPYRPLTGKERWELYVRNVYLSPAAFLRPVWSASTNQLSNDPPEWDGVKGFGQRMGFRFTARVARNSIEDAGMALVGHDPRYKPCRCENKFKRAGHAVLFNFLTLDSKGRTTLNAFRYIGAYGGELAVAGMLPGNYDVWQAMRRGNAVVTWGSLNNLLREFSPELIRLLRLKTR
jgi:hypothetical protein